MTDLNRLKVSLTKHGAHKIAVLLKKYPPDRVLQHVSGSQPGINIASSLAKTTLAATDGNVPLLWSAAKRLGGPAIDALVFVAIVVSHHRLIEAMRKSQKLKHFRGTITKGQTVGGKTFTNFAHTVEQLGFSTHHTPQTVGYDLGPLFRVPGLGMLVEQLLRAKLLAAGWDGDNTVVEESTRLRINEAFCLSKSQFRAWLPNQLRRELRGISSTKDAEFFFGRPDDQTPPPFKFKPGHKKRKTGRISVSNSPDDSEALLLHNEMQEKLHKSLCKKYGASAVGTERRLGKMSIDAVVKRGGSYWFYEIKTADSARACIRQALPQLLEYSYWPGNIARAAKLVIVGPCRLTPHARRYLEYLKSSFSLPLEYQEQSIGKNLRKRIKREAAQHT